MTKLDIRERVRTALNKVGAMPLLRGPNGPISDRRIVMPDGTVRRDLFAVAREWGLMPLVQLDYVGREEFAGVSSDDNREWWSKLVISKKGNSKYYPFFIVTLNKGLYLNNCPTPL